MLGVLLGEFGPYIAGALTAVGVLWATYCRGSASGVKKVHDKITKGTIARKEKRDEIDNDVRLVDAADELRRNWSRTRP
jgi:hypothetical protein